MREEETDLSFAELGGSKRLQHRSATFRKQVTPRKQWRAGRDSNPRPSGSKKKPNPKQVDNLCSNDRHMAAPEAAYGTQAATLSNGETPLDSSAVACAYSGGGVLSDELQLPKLFSALVHE